jgi:hypothetical protein
MREDDAELIVQRVEQRAQIVGLAHSNAPTGIT